MESWEAPKVVVRGACRMAIDWARVMMTKQ